MRRLYKNQSETAVKAPVNKPYNGQADAERLLEGVLQRQRYQAPVRDELASELEQIVAKRVAKIKEVRKR